METDYTVIPVDHFAEAVKRYAAFQLRRPEKSQVPDLYPEQGNWGKFSLGELFKIKKGKRLTKADQSPGDTPYITLFIATLIRQEKYRFNYGRKWHMNRMKESCIRLLVKADNAPDWEFMERYIKSLPYSSQIESA